MDLINARLLDVVAPACTAGAFFAIEMLEFRVDSPRSPRIHRTLSRTTTCIACCIAVTYLIQSVLYIHDASDQRGHERSGQAPMHSLLELLVWLTISLLLLIRSQPSWKSVTAGATVNGVLEIPLLVLLFRNKQMHSFWRTLLAMATSRLLLCYVLSGICAFQAWREPISAPKDETEPLLGQTTSSSSVSSGSYDSTSEEFDRDSDRDSDSDSDTDGVEGAAVPKRLSTKQREALTQKGGLYNYLSQFAIFMPYLWPRENRKIRAYFVVIGLSTLAERALKVLYPRQLGIVVDKLYRVAASGGPVPWQDILLWILYELLQNESCGLSAITEALENRTSNWTCLSLSVAAYDHVMGLPMKFHDSKASGELIKAVEQASSLHSLFRVLVLETVPFIVDMFVALWFVSVLLDTYGTIIVLYVAVFFVFVTYTISILMRKARRAYASDTRLQSRLLYETISNWSTVSHFSRRGHEHDRLSHAAEKSVLSGQWDNDLALCLFGAENFVEILGRLAVSLLAAWRIALGLTPVGNFVAIELYWDSITMPLWHMSHSFRQLSSDLIDAERLLELFQQCPDMKDGPRSMPAYVAGEVEFLNVSFGYSSKQLTINDLSFHAQPGQTIAIVGETGSGKSTTLKLLMRFYDIASGSIKIDGIDVRDVTVDSLRQLFGIVPQNAVLFNLSILENVRYGKLDATDEEVHDACRAAAIHERILSLPNGYQSKAGERGVKLSGGELQRIAIARVILKDPQIVLLDEATSALDTETESKVQEALRVLTSGRTTIVIAHRLSTIVGADMILVVDKGRVVEQGSHASLMQKGDGKYKRYWAQQTWSQDAVG